MLKEKTQEKDFKVSFRIPKESKERFYEACHRNNYLPSEVVRFLIKQYNEENL